MKIFKRGLRIFLSALLLFACCFSLTGCNLEPSEIETWYIRTYEVDGKKYEAGDIYENEVFHPTLITAKFSDSRVTLNVFGEERQGKYAYTAATMIPERDSKLTITFDDGEKYEGDCYSAVFDGRIDYLHFSNGKETFHFEVEAVSRYEEPHSLYLSTLFSTYTEVDYLDSMDYLSDGSVMASYIEQGDKKVELTDISIVTEFLPLAKEETLRYFKPDEYYGEYMENYCTPYRFHLEIQQENGYAKINHEFDFYYDSHTDFYFVEYQTINYHRVGISAQKESVFTYLVALLES